MEGIKKPAKSDSNRPEFTGFSFRPPPAAANKLFLRGKLLPCKPIPPPPKKVSPLSLRRPESPDPKDRRRYMRLGAESPESKQPKKRVVCVLGVVRLPAEMEMKDIKIRQRRLGPPPVTAEEGRRRVLYWGILQSLSCKATVSTAVAPATAVR